MAQIESGQDFYKIEAVVGGKDGLFNFGVFTAEAAPLPWETLVNMLSRRIRTTVRENTGIILPDLRFRLIMTPNDSLAGVHFGTLDGAIKKTQKLQSAYAAEISRSMMESFNTKVIP